MKRFTSRSQGLNESRNRDCHVGCDRFPLPKGGVLTQKHIQSANPPGQYRYNISHHRKKRNINDSKVQRLIGDMYGYVRFFLEGSWYLNVDMGVSKNRGTPKWMVKIMENPIKMDDLGGKPTIFGNIHILLMLPVPPGMYANPVGN